MQGFPDDYLFACGYNRATKMIGQAIQIDVGRAILKAVCRDAGVLGGEARAESREQVANAEE